MPQFPVYDEKPYRLSGVVYGALLNQPSALEQIGTAAHEPPHKAPPKGPVLYIKPRNTLVPDGQAVAIPEGEEAMRVGATIGLVIGRAACQVNVSQAMNYVSGLLLVADLTVPHDTFYRPSVRFVARDRSCLLGGKITTDLDPDALTIDVKIEGKFAQQVSMQGLVRPAARLLADVTEFMTLSAGDVLLMGARIDGPLVRRGQTFSLAAEGMQTLEGTTQ